MRKKKKKISWQGQVFMILGILMAAIFLPSTVLLVAGMLPTFVALLVDRSHGKIKSITIGAMNAAGCMPFLYDLWKSGHVFEKTFEIITDPMAIIVMYAAAGTGYVLDWVMSGIVSAVMYQRGQSRQKDIQKKQQELIERWGKEVTGEIPLDEYGFPKETKKAQKPGKSYPGKTKTS